MELFHPKTAKSTAMDFWYACIPALLLLCMLSQFIILFWLILPGVAIDAIELFISCFSQSVGWNVYVRIYHTL